MLATIVHTDELLQTVMAAVVGGLGITLAFSIGIWGTGQSLELTRGERPVAATAAGLVAVLAFLTVAAAVIVGIVVMTQN